MRRVSCALVVFAAALTLGAGTAAANTKYDHCTSPSGRDLNQFYGVTERVLIFPFCAQLRTGEQWRPGLLWAMNTSFEQVPAGFVPGGATPTDDFRAKLVSARYVIDAGTRQERTYVFANNDTLWTGVAFGLPAVNTITLGVLHPLSKGQHTIDRYWHFNAMHCDGLDSVIGENCIGGPLGDYHYGPQLTFQVVTP